MRWFTLICAVSAAFALANDGRSLGSEMFFDFNSGLGPDFSVVNSSGGLFTVNTSGPNLRISKASDDGSISPYGLGGIAAGIRSRFLLNGNFTATVDFSLYDFPGVSGPGTLNESILAVSPATGTDFWVLRYTEDSNNFVEGWSVPPTGVLLWQYDASIEGRYQISRSGSTLTAAFAPEGSSSFTSLGDYTDPAFSQPMYIELLARQVGDSGGYRSTSSLDVAFDNLIVDADSITAAVPEPSALIRICSLLGVLGITVGWWRRGKAA